MPQYPLFNFTFVTRVRLDAEDQAVLAALVERERVSKSQLVRSGLRLLGGGADIPAIDAVDRDAPSITVRFEKSDEELLARLCKRERMPKQTLLRASVRALAKHKGVRVSKRRKASAA